MVRFIQRSTSTTATRTLLACLTFHNTPHRFLGFSSCISRHTNLISTEAFVPITEKNPIRREGFSTSTSLIGSSVQILSSSRRNINLIQFSTTSSTSTEEIMASSSSSKKKVLIPIADGSEEIETTCIQVILVRFGADVTIASVKPNSDLVCIMSRGIKIMADCTIDDAVACGSEGYDMIVLPGGMPGAEHLRDCTALIQLLHKQKESGKWYGAICAAPAIALQPNNLFDDDMKVTCYPAPKFREAISKYAVVDDTTTTTITDANNLVVVSKNCITSQGPGTAIQFGLKLGEVLYGTEKRNEIAKALLVL